MYDYIPSYVRDKLTIKRGGGGSWSWDMDRDVQNAMSSIND